MFNDSYLRACMKLRIVQKIRFSLLESGRTRAWCPGLVSRPSAKAQEPLARSTRREKVKMYKIQWNHHTEEEATWETENFLQRNFPDFLRTNSGIKSFHTFSSCNLGARFLLGGEVVTPQVSAQQLCIYCVHHVLELFEKGSFCKYKGYMCNYDFMQGPLYSFI